MEARLDIVEDIVDAAGQLLHHFLIAPRVPRVFDLVDRWGEMEYGFGFSLGIMDQIVQPSGIVLIHIEKVIAGIEYGLA